MKKILKNGYINKVKSINFRIVKVRKKHLCHICEKDINIGEKAEFYNFKSPKYDDNYIQIGIEYCRFYICINNHDNCFI